MVGGFIGLTSLPANFEYLPFAGLLLALGLGQGMFAAPNTTAMMNSVPPETRGVSSGMIATIRNGATLMSIGVFFSIVTVGLAAALPPSIFSGLTNAGLPASVAGPVANLPPTAALFAAFLGYNPLATLLSPAVLQQLPAASQATLTSTQYFPSLIASPFMVGLHAVFYLSAGMCVVAAVASLLRGKVYIHDEAARGAIAAGESIEATALIDEETSADLVVKRMNGSAP